LTALDLLSGDAQTFLAKVWASRTHLHRTDPDLLVGLLSLDDADQLLTSTAIRTPSIRLARDGTVLPESAYTRSRASRSPAWSTAARRSACWPTGRPWCSRACTATGRR